MTVTADALDMLAGDPPRYPHIPGDFHRHPETGAPYVAHPTETNRDSTPRRVMYGRPSNFGAALDNPYSLIKWMDRIELVGAALMDLDYGYVLANRDNDKVLDGVAAKCYELAGRNLAADRGTHVHKLLEEHDINGPFGWQWLGTEGEALGIPAELQARIVAQWYDFRQRLGVTALAVEQTVVNDRWRLAGTLDRLDVADHDILTSFGVLEAGVPFVGDIKTGGLTLGNDGQPNYWVKYPVQLAAYVDSCPYDTDMDQRISYEGPQCSTDVALIYHYDLARALAGELVDWQAIPVNVQAGREGGDLCRAAADFAKRRDLFAMPAPSVSGAGKPPPDSGQPERLVWHAVDGTTGDAPLTPSAVPVPVPNRAVEQQADDQEPDTASRPVPGRAATPDKLRARIAELVAAGHEQMMRRHWPADVPTLKHDGHTDDQLARILAAVRSVEAQVGAGWHPDDGAEPSARLAQKRALRAWEGLDADAAFFAASLIATFKQCRNPDVTLEAFVAQFTIEQAERLYLAAMP